MRGLVGTGVALTLLVTAALGVRFGVTALLPGISFGLLATGLQVVAVGALRRGFHGSHAAFLKGYAAGAGLRLAGVALVLAAVLVDGVHFAPIPSAFGYLGVTVPLLFLEVRLLR